MANVIIIGGGVAGLSAGIYSQKYGHHATIFEKNPIVGGNLTGWQRGNYHIDNCLHWLTGTNPASAEYQMWKDLGVLDHVDVYHANSLFTCDHKGLTLTLYRNLKHTIRDMLHISPSDRKEILSFFHAIQIIQGLLGTAGPEHNQHGNFFSTLISIPELIRYYRMTGKELSSHFSHPLLSKFMLSFWPEQFSSLAFLTVAAVFCSDNGGIPIGGSCAMAERMKEKFLSLGGKIQVRKEAVKINMNGHHATSVTFRDGQTVPTDNIIITLDPQTVFGTLLNVPMPTALQKQLDNPRLSLFSSYQCALSCDKDKLPFHGELVFDIPHKYQTKLHSKRMILREFSHETDFAPKGKSVLQTMIFCSEKDSRAFINMRTNNRIAYRSKKKELEQIIQQVLIEKFPLLKKNLKCIDMWTPATYNRYVGSDMGSFMGFAFPSNFIPKMLSNRISGADNVLLATQWLQAPGGLPIAAKTGQLAAAKIASLPSTKKLSTI